MRTDLPRVDSDLPKADAAPDVSVIIPVYNEAANLDLLLSRMLNVMNTLGRSYEIVLVDDGSTDDGMAILQRFQAAENRIRIVRLARNFGQTPAMYAGFAHARGQIVVQLDADLQNPPEEIPKLIEKLEEGYDVVQGWRENRQDSGFRRTASRLMNEVISRLIGARIRDLGCGLKAYRRPVIESMIQFSHHARYVPAEIVWLGVRMAEVKVKHSERAAGTSKYGLATLLKLNFDMITSISSAPIQVIGWIGWVFALMGLAAGIRVVYYRLVYGDVNQLTSIAALFFFLAGIHLIATGVLCEYIGKIFSMVQRKPDYVVRDIVE